MSPFAATHTAPQSLSTMLLKAAASLLARRPATARRTPAAPAACLLAVEKNAIHALARPQGRTVTCESGTLWLTFDHVPADVILGAGDAYVCRTDSPLLIQALQDSRVQVD